MVNVRHAQGYTRDLMSKVGIWIDIVTLYAYNCIRRSKIMTAFITDHRNTSQALEDIP